MPDGGPTFDGLTFRRVLAHANGGGAYRATDADGRSVFVKEARGSDGYSWDGAAAAERLAHEDDVLRRPQAEVLGVAPEPLRFFRRWEHDFLVTEMVPGTPLWTWMVTHNPLITVDPPPAPCLGPRRRPGGHEGGDTAWPPLPPILSWG